MLKRSKRLSNCFWRCRVANSQPKEDLFMDQRHFEYFAKDWNIWPRKLTTLLSSKSAGLRRINFPRPILCCTGGAPVEINMTRASTKCFAFLRLTEKEQPTLFPYGPGGYPGIGREWQETTDWPADMTAPIKDPGLRVVKYPKISRPMFQ